MLGSFFKQGWQSNSTETRLSSVEKLDPADTNNQHILKELANGDPDKNVRNAALSKIIDPSILFNISDLHDSPETKLDAKNAFAKLLGVKGQLSEQQLTELSIAIPASIPSIIQHGQHGQLRANLICKFSEIDLANMLSEIEYTDTRVLIAEKIESIEALEFARKGLKGKDKNAEKIVKEKIDLIHAQQKLDKENAEAALTLCEKMEYLADHLGSDEWRAEFKGQYSVWSQRWNELDFNPDKEISGRYTTAYEKVTPAVETIIKITDAQAVQQELCNDIKLDCSQVAKLSLQELHKQQSRLSDKLSSLVSEWEKQKEIVAPAVNIDETFKQTTSSLESVLAFNQAISAQDNSLASLQSAIAKLNWNIPDVGLSSQAEAQAQLDELISQATDKKQTEKDKLDKLHKRMHRLLGVTKQGNLAQSRRELTAITKAIEHYSGKDRVILDERLEKADQVVTKMADWNNFVTEPKYLELCDAMEALVGTKSNPDKLAKKIHALQEQWKGLGYSDSSGTHWERFKTAADSAYEPCAEFFKQRQATRRENLIKREPYLAQMRALWEDTEWDESPDYKSIEISVRKTMQQWQKVKDVEQGPGQKQWKKLTKLKSKVNEKLDVVYDANIELKNQLIRQTNSLLEFDVNDQTLTKLQLFQSRWKQIGITRRKQDQAAWKRFKKSSDAVYAKIQGLRKEVRAEEDAQINQYRDIIKQVQNLAKSADNLATGDNQFTQLQTDYGALPELPTNLPEKLVKNLAVDYQRACEAYSKTRQRIIQVGRSKVLETLDKKAQLCAQLEQLDANAPAERAQQLQVALNEITIEDKALEKQIGKRIANALNCDHKKASDTRRRLCIDLEVLLGVDSPAEDKSLRMSIQMERLKNKGLGQGHLTQNDKTLGQAKIDWLCLPGADQTTQAALDKRFYSVMKKTSKKPKS